MAGSDVVTDDHTILQGAAQQQLRGGTPAQNLRSTGHAVLWLMSICILSGRDILTTLPKAAGYVQS
jgi:hypothetical protein